MSEEVDPAVLKSTKDALGGYVKKPPLSDKLLSKPPFKFLHDVFSVVIRDHGLMEGLFTPSEMNSANFKDKESKVAYIQKVIDTLEFVNEEKLSVKPGKVVAGLEAGKTNALLQAIGKALTHKADSVGAVQKVLSGEKFSSGKKSKKAANGSSPKKGKSLTDATNKSPDKKNRDKDKDKKKKKDDAEEKPKKTKKDKEGDKTKKSKKDSKSEDEKKASKEKKKEETPTETAEPAAALAVSADGGREQPTPPATRPPSGRPVSSRPVSGRPTSQRPASGRPGSARLVASSALPPTLPEETSSIAEEPVTLGGASTLGEEPEPELMQQLGGDGDAEFNMDTTVPLNDTARAHSARPRSAVRSARPSSARPAAPRPRPRAVIEQEIGDASTSGGGGAQTAAPVLFDDDDDDDDNFVVEEKPSSTDSGLASMLTAQGDSLTERAADGDHGLLVSQILETKKTMEDEIIGSAKQETRAERALSAVDRSRFMDKDAIRREVVRLRETIQKVTKSANPLGKMMDFLQEDVDSMQRELDKWRQENRTITQQIRAEVQSTNQSIEPLRAALAEYEHNIQDQLDRISAVRGATLTNDLKIAKLMSGVMSVAVAATVVE